MAQLMPLPLTVSCFSKIQIGLIFLVLAQPGSPGQRAIKQCVCVLSDIPKALAAQVHITNTVEAKLYKTAMYLCKAHTSMRLIEPRQMYSAHTSNNTHSTLNTLLSQNHLSAD